MIGKITKGDSPSGALKYATGKEGAELLDTNCASNDAAGIGEEMDVMSASNSRCEKHCIHISLSAPAGEKLTDDEWRKAAEITRREMGLENNQFALVKHSDQDHDHVHMICERVDADGKAWSDKYDFQRLHTAMRVVENEVGLEKMSDHTKSVDGRFNAIKKDLQASIRGAGKNGIEGFKKEMNSKGYDVIETKQANGKISGMSIKSREDGKTWKASELQKGGSRSIQWQLDKQAGIEKASNQQAQQQKQAASSSKNLGTAAAKAITAGPKLGNDKFTSKAIAALSKPNQRPRAKQQQQLER
jgi:hypothetical protein